MTVVCFQLRLRKQQRSSQGVGHAGRRDSGCQCDGFGSEQCGAFTSEDERLRWEKLLSQFHVDVLSFFSPVFVNAARRWN